MANPNRSATISAGPRGSVRPSRYDVAVFALIMGALAAIGVSGHEINRPLAAVQSAAISLDPSNLPNYALLSTFRMFAAMAASLVFTFVVATLAAKSRKAEMVIVPALDILQSVPVLGFLSFTVLMFLQAFPGRQVGAELAAIFAIFTSQAWNMAFSFYQSLKTVPRDLDDACQQFHLSAWQRFWRLEAPFAAPGLIWNAMMSMSGGWFFVVASEAIAVGDTTISLPGLGSYLATAIAQKNLHAVAWAVFAMAVLIFLYDQVVFRPIVAWADKFRMELSAAPDRPESLVYDLFRSARLVHRFLAPAGKIAAWVSAASVRAPAPAAAAPVPERVRRIGDIAWLVLVGLTSAWAAWLTFRYIAQSLSFADAGTAILYGFYTLIRVVVLIAIATLIWVPIGVYIGLRPRLTQTIQPLVQFLAAFPANVLFPMAVVVIARHHLNPNIWLSPLMVLGTQWYILFNVIAGASAFPNDLREAARLTGVKGWQWWYRVILPGIFPYYVTGALTASGGSWNAAIVAEVASWGNTRLEARGLGAYIADATAAGDYRRVVLGIAVMALIVIMFNRLVWRRLYDFADQRLRLN